MHPNAKPILDQAVACRLHVRWCGPLHLRKPCRGIGLHRAEGAVWCRADGQAANRTGAQRAGRELHPTATSPPTCFVGAPCGLFCWGAMPLAFLAARSSCSESTRPLVGIVLLLGAMRLLWPAELGANREPRGRKTLEADGRGHGLIGHWAEISCLINVLCRTPSPPI